MWGLFEHNVGCAYHFAVQ